MSQRSYANDRNRKGAKVGSTRKSAAAAKPVHKQGSVGGSTSSSKPKKAASGPEKDWSGLPTSPEIKKWRKVWWVLLLSGLGAIGVSYLVPEFRTNEQVLKIVSVAVLVFSAAAILIDVVVIRKLRKELIAKAEKKKSPKATVAEAAAPKNGKAPKPVSDNEALDKSSKKGAS